DEDAGWRCTVAVHWALSGMAVLAVGPGRDLCQELARVGAGRLGDRLGRTFGDDLAALLAALGPEVDDVVGRLDHVEVVLDDQHGVAGVDQPVEHAEELLHIVEVQSSRRFVEDVEHFAGRTGPELGGDLEALCLAARQSRRRLTEAEIAEPDRLQSLQTAGEAVLRGEEVDGLVDGQVEHVADAAVAELHAEHVGPVASALALLTGDVHILEEVHLELLESVALTRLAAAALHVERERTRVEPERLGPRERGEELADL